MDKLLQLVKLVSREGANRKKKVLRSLSFSQKHSFALPCVVAVDAWTGMLWILDVAAWLGGSSGRISK